MAGNKHDNGVHEQGTDETRNAYQEDTPGQSVEKYIEDRNKAYHEEAAEKKKKHFSQVFQNPLKGFPYNEEIEISLKEVREGVYTKNDGGAFDGLRIAKWLAHEDGKSWRRLSYGETEGYLTDAGELLKKDKSKARDILSQPTPRD